MSTKKWYLLIVGMVYAFIALVVWLVSPSTRKEAQTFQDSRSGQYITQAQADHHVARIKSGFIGVGLSVSPVSLASADGVVVNNVEAASTAEEAGLKVGDRIIATYQAYASDDPDANDGMAGFGNWSLSEVANAIQGTPGTSTTLTVVRDGTNREVSVNRDVDGKIGIGLEAAHPIRLYQIDQVLPGSPAQAAGIQEKDIITQVDGFGADKMDQDSLLAALRGGMRPKKGTIGSTVSLTVLEAHLPMEFTLKHGIVPDWELSYGWEARGGGDGKDLSYNQATVRITNLDWDGMVARLDADMDDLNKIPGAILDLRGASGDDPSIAAQVLARFVRTREPLIQLQVLDNGNDQLDAFYAIDGKVYRVLYAYDKASHQAIGPVWEHGVNLGSSGKLYSGKLVVLVDDRTSGTAEALAYTLQNTRRAKIVGFKTAGLPVLASFTSTQKNTRGMLITGDTHRPLGAIHPDHSVFQRSNLKVAAEHELEGMRWYTDPTVITYTVAALFVLAFIALTVREIRRGRLSNSGCDEDCSCCGLETGEREDTGDQPGQLDADDALRETGLAMGYSAPAAMKEKPKRRFLNNPLVGIGLVVLGGIAVISFQHFQSDHRFARVEVTTYVDGSLASNQQKQVNDQMASQYTGSIDFHTVDLREQPSYSGGQAITAPYTTITVRWYRIDGGQLREQSESLGGLAPKRDIVSIIGYMAKSDDRSWPGADIQFKPLPLPTGN